MRLRRTFKGTSQGAAPPPDDVLRRHQQPNVAGGYGVGVTPVPISNTVVKPHSADGTAGLSGGRVRRRQPHFRPPEPPGSGGLFS